MNRKDFARKANSYAPVLVNSSYSNFRFSERAKDVFSPLSRSKFGFQSKKHLRKMSSNISSYAVTAGNSPSMATSPYRSNHGGIELKQKITSDTNDDGAAS